MGLLLAVTIGLLFALVVAGCGGAAVSANSTVTRAGSLRNDGDRDGVAADAPNDGTGADHDDDSYSGEGYYDFDDENVLDYGHLANASDAAAVEVIVMRYYAYAARDDGEQVCRLLVASVARAIPAEYGNEPGLNVSDSHGCAAVMTALLKTLHTQWSGESRTLRPGTVRVDGATAEALLGFDAEWANRYTVLRREHGAWRVASLTAQALP